MPAPITCGRITLVNPTDREWTSSRFVLAFGAYGDTVLACYANNLQDALEEAIEWLAEHAPGMLCTEAVHEEYAREIAAGKSEEEAMTAAEVDTDQHDGHYLNSAEWTILAEDPTRSEFLTLAAA